MKKILLILVCLFFTAPLFGNVFEEDLRNTEWQALNKSNDNLVVISFTYEQFNMKIYSNGILISDDREVPDKYDKINGVHYYKYGQSAITFTIIKNKLHMVIIGTNTEDNYIRSYIFDRVK
ncbi:MAG: hypothetical protein ACRC31_03255 [Cetobacterium sp.]